MSGSTASGSVYQRSSDGRWAAAFKDPDTGRRGVLYASSDQAASRLLRSMTSRSDNGDVVADSRATVEQYARDWFDSRAGRRRRPSTVREYRWRFDKYILPTLGGHRIGDLTVVDVEDLLDRQAERGLSQATLRATRNALAAMLTDAIRRRLLRSGNVATLAQLPELETAAGGRRMPTTDQVSRLLAAADGTELGRLLTVLASSGARIGEVLAATWLDMNLEAGVWAVRRTVTRDLQGTVVLGTRTKTGNERRVALGDQAVTGLRAQRAHVVQQQMRSAYWQDHDLVFPTSIGTVRDARNLRKDLRPLAASVGFPGSFHGLRHWVASVALSTTTDAVTAKVLGHARKATTTDLYGHLLDADAVGVSDAVARALSASNPDT